MESGKSKTDRFGSLIPDDRIRVVGVIGAGLMGRQIALVAAEHGVPVVITDASSTIIEEAVHWIGERKSAHAASIDTCTSWEDFHRADLIVESVSENLRTKQKVLADVETAANPVLLASNTSSLPIGRIAERLTQPERFLGLHFCHPVTNRRLVEVVSGALTEQSMLETAEHFARTIGRIPIRTADSPGFLLNRLLVPYLNAAMALAEDGVPIPEIDAAIESLGIPLGPFRFMDGIGLDVALRVGRHVEPVLQTPLPPPQILLTLYERGHRGKKTEAGFYQYRDESIVGLHLEAGRPFSKQARRTVSPDVIRSQLLTPLIEEAERTVAQRVVTDWGDVDTALIHGVAFPRMERLRTTVRLAQHH